MSARTGAVSLSSVSVAVCALPGCRAGVCAPGECCQECVAAFGVFLHRFDSDRTSEEIAAELEARDAGTRAAYKAQAAIKQQAERGGLPAAVR